MNQLLTSSVISVIYFVLKFTEMRLILKENKPLKDLFKDTLLVFISASLCLIILEAVTYLFQCIIFRNLVNVDMES